MTAGPLNASGMADSGRNGNSRPGRGTTYLQLVGSRLVMSVSYPRTLAPNRTFCNRPSLHFDRLYA